MSNKPKGGRGHAAPYETKQMRVPVGLEPQIQELIARYREWISSSGSSIVGCDNPPRLLDKLVDSFSETSVSNTKPVDNFNDAGVVVWNVYERVRGKDEEWKLVGSHKTEYAADSQIKTRKDHNYRKNSMNDYGILSLEWEVRLEQILPIEAARR